MGKYVEKCLYDNEWIVEKAKRDKWGLIGRWTLVVFLFAAAVTALYFAIKTQNTYLWIATAVAAVLFLFPFIFAIKATIVFNCIELIVTNKRIVRKSGVFHTQAFDVPLSKISNVYVQTTFWGRIFNTNRIRINTAIGVIVDKLADADDFKNTILGQIDQFEEERLARQAAWTARAMNANSND